MELPYNFFHRLKFAFTVEHWLSLKATQAGKNPYTQLKKIKKIAQYIWRLGSGIHILSEISLVAFTALPSNPRCFMLYEDDIPPAYWTNVSLSENYRIGNEKQVPNKVHSCCLYVIYYNWWQNTLVWSCHYGVLTISCFFLSTILSFPQVSVKFRSNTAILSSAVYASSFRDCTWSSLFYPYFDNRSILKWPLWDLG